MSHAAPSAAPGDLGPASHAAGAYDDEHTRLNYPKGVEHHWWTMARNAIIARRLRRVLRTGERAIEIGCGTGVVVDALRGRGFDVVGVDLARGTPATPRVAPHVRLGVEALALPEDEARGYSAVLLLDVLEHMGEPARFLAAVRERFRSARGAFVTLPARQEVWSNYDEFFGHHARYDRRRVLSLETVGAVRVERAGYFFHALYPVMLGLTLARVRRRTAMAAPAPAARPLHAALAALFVAESRVLPGALPGLSLSAWLRFDR